MGYSYGMAKKNKQKKFGITKKYSQRDLETDWNTFANYDPMWAILRDESKKNRGWNEEEFYNTGKLEITAILDKAKELGYPKSYGTALDICCGIGRLTSNLIGHFDKVIGLDISQKMVDIANEKHKQATFVRGNSLDFLGDQKVDLIMERIGFQHSDPEYVLNYIKGALKHLAVGGLFTFMMPPDEDPNYKKYRDEAIATRIDNRPLMLMYSIPIITIVNLIRSNGGVILERQETEGRFASCFYWVTKLK